MPALIYDNSASAFKEAENPKINVNDTFVDSNGMVHKDGIWKEGYSAFIKGVDAVQVNGVYTLGSGAHTNRGGTISVKCLSKSGNTAVMQTYGVTGASWPGSGDLTSSYSSYWGTLSSAISGVKLPTGSSTSNISPSGSYEILRSAAGNARSFGATVVQDAWLGTSDYDGGAYLVVYSNGNVGYTLAISSLCVIAPYFTLDLTKVKVDPKAPTVLLAK